MKNLECQYCEYKSLRKDNLIRHMKRKHGIDVPRKTKKYILRFHENQPLNSEEKSITSRIVTNVRSVEHAYSDKSESVEIKNIVTHTILICNNPKEWKKRNYTC